MKSDCHAFRSALEAELLGRPAPEKLAGLSWHVHLLACGECRDLLAKEEALEMLLASLPEPKLPAVILERVLARLGAERAVDSRLDALLDVAIDAGASAPEGLARRVLAGLASEREKPDPKTRGAEARLDALLDLDREIEVPAGLARRVLAALAAQRAMPRPAAARMPSSIRRSWIYAAAAAILFVLGLTYWLRSNPPSTGQGELVADDPSSDPDPQMLAALDVLEEWDLLMQYDVDVLLSTLGPADEALLDYP